MVAAVEVVAVTGAAAVDRVPVTMATDGYCYHYYSERGPLAARDRKGHTQRV